MYQFVGNVSKSTDPPLFQQLFMQYESGAGIHRQKQQFNINNRNGIVIKGMISTPSFIIYLLNMCILHVMIFHKDLYTGIFTPLELLPESIVSFSLQNSSWSFPGSLDTVNWPCTDPVMPTVSRALPGWQVREDETSSESRPTGLWLYRVMNYLSCFVIGSGIQLVHCII